MSLHLDALAQAQTSQELVDYFDDHGWDLVQETLMQAAEEVVSRLIIDPDGSGLLLRDQVLFHEATLRKAATALQIKKSSIIMSTETSSQIPVVIFKSGKRISGSYMAVQVHKFDRDPTYSIYVTAFDSEKGKQYEIKVLSKCVYRTRDPKTIDHFCCQICERLDIHVKYDEMQLLSVEAASKGKSKKGKKS